MTKLIMISLLVVSAGTGAFSQDSRITEDFFHDSRYGTVADVQAGLDRGESLTQRQSSDNLTPLFFAVRYNKPEVAQVLLKAGARIDDKDAAGASAVLNALMFNPDPAMLQLLLKAGAKLTDKDAGGWTALMYSTINPNPEIFRTMLRMGAKVSERDHDGLTALMHAAWRSPAAVVQDLIKAGAKVNDQDNEGITPLMRASGGTQPPEVAAALLKAGARLDVLDRSGSSALVFAAQNRNPEVARLILKAGGKVNERGKDGTTPLHIAAMFNPYPEMIPVLLEAGAKLEERDAEGMTPLLAAALYNSNPKVVLALLAAGADSTAVSASGQSALSMIRDNPNGKGTIAQEALEKAPKAAGYQAPSPAPAVKASALPKGVWIAKIDASMMQWVGNGWDIQSGAAKSLAQGGNEIWSVGVEPAPGGYRIWHYGPAGWESIPGGAVRIAVGPDGQPWIVDDQNRIFRRAGKEWKAMPGRATDIGVGADGTAWIIGTTPADGGYEILRWTGKTWSSIDGAAVRIAVAPKGDPWVVNSSGLVFHRPGGVWQALAGIKAKSVAVGKDGTVLLVQDTKPWSVAFVSHQDKIVLIDGAVAEVSLP